MNSRSRSSRTSAASSRSAIGCALLGILTASLLLTACSTVSSGSKPSPSPVLILSQPPVLRLQAGQPVQTKDGSYTPATDEVWHSDARFRHAEQQASDAAAALAQERARLK